MNLVSIIIPTLNEEQIIQPCLQQFEGQSTPYEIIVVDGGSTDKTVEIVNSYADVKLVQAEKSGRGVQMNLGAEMASGDKLLFLHADTFLPSGGLRLIREVLDDDKVSGGSFSLCFDRQNHLLNFFSYMSKINNILFTYGDQGLFLTRKTFINIGGFAEIALMEDVEIQRRLRKTGSFVKLENCVITSSRRFIHQGILRQQLLNTTLVLLYHLGVSPSRLVHHYKQISS